MANCFITKFQGVADNEMLTGVGEILFFQSKTDPEGKLTVGISAHENREITISPVKGSVYVSLNDTKPTDPITEPVTYTTTSSSSNNKNVRVWLSEANNEGVFSVQNYYDIGNVSNNANIKVKNLKYLANPVVINVGEGLVSEMSDFDNLGNITSLVFTELLIEDVSYATILPKFTSLQVLNMGDGLLPITLESLGASLATSITNIRLTTQLTTGTIEGFVAQQVKKGRTSQGTNVTINAYNYTPQITFNNNTCAAQSKFTWAESSGNTVITCGGVSTTIHVNNDGTWTRVS